MFIITNPKTFSLKLYPEDTTGNRKNWFLLLLYPVQFFCTIIEMFYTVYPQYKLNRDAGAYGQKKTVSILLETKQGVAPISSSCMTDVYYSRIKINSLLATFHT